MKTFERSWLALVNLEMQTFLSHFQYVSWSAGATQRSPYEPCLTGDLARQY